MPEKNMPIDKSIKGTLESAKKLKSDIYNFKRSASHYSNSCSDERRPLLVDPVLSLWTELDRVEKQLDEIISSASTDGGSLKKVLDDVLVENRLKQLPSLEQVQKELAILAGRASVYPECSFSVVLSVEDEKRESVASLKFCSESASDCALQPPLRHVDDIETALMLAAYRAFTLLRKQNDEYMNVLMHGKVLLTLEVHQPQGHVTRKWSVALTRDQERGPTISSLEGVLTRRIFVDEIEKDCASRLIRYDFSEGTVKWVPEKDS